MERPKVRAVEAFPVEQNGQTMVCLRDSTGLAPNPVVLGMGAYFIVTLFNGINDLRDVQSAFMKRFGELVPLEQLSGLADALDKAFFLDSPAFRELEQHEREAFMARPDRPAALAGLCYNKDAGAL